MITSNLTLDQRLAQCAAGGYYRCTLWQDTIADFRAAWPCSGIDPRVYRVCPTWDSSGDLVDLGVYYRNGRIVDPALYDGPAMVALINDAQRQMHPEHSR